MELLPILLPLLIPIFSKLFANCATPASGQTSDPRAEVLALRQPDGSFKRSAIVASRRHSKHAIRMSNRGKRRTDPTFIQPTNANADQATVAMFNHVLAQPAKTVMASYAAGCAASFNPDDGE